jgi:hypothetical protein
MTIRKYLDRLITIEIDLGKQRELIAVTDTCDALNQFSRKKGLLSNILPISICAEVTNL